MSEPEKQPAQRTPNVLRLIFQGSVPLESVEQAEQWYAMLKEMLVSQSPKSTLNGQIMKMLEPCCGEKKT